ncbi:uncharacterized protein LOC144124461 [Amblyomma americanum]
MPLVDTPFRRVAVDIIGPLKPTTRKGNRYIMTLVDYATRFPEAVALPSIETERVAEALLQIFARVGVPGEMLSDRGSNFTSEFMAEVGRLLSLRLQTTSPYHPMANGLVGGPQASTGFSPFGLLYGRNVRGPLTILKELWTGDKVEETKTAYQYVVDLRERLETTCQMAHEALEEAGERYKRYYDRGSKSRALQVGDQVLLLLPTEHNKLTMKWKGPYVAKGNKGEVDYVVDVEGNPKTFHVNMLKKYFSRVPETDSHVPVVAAVASNIEDGALVWPLGEQADHRDVAASKKLTPPQAQELRFLISRHKELFSDGPGYTTWAVCNLTTTIIVQAHPGQAVPASLRSASGS